MEVEKLGIDGLSSLLNSFFHNSETAFLFIDENGSITAVNKAFSCLSGFFQNELLQKRLQDFITSDLISIYEKDTFSVINGNMDCGLKTKAGNILEVRLLFTHVTDAGDKGGMAVTVENKPASKNGFIEVNLQRDSFQIELENTISKFTTLIDNSRDVLYSIYYETLRFEYLSPSVVELTGFNRDELLAMSPLQMLRIINPEFRKMYLRYWKSLKKRIHRTNQTIEYKIRPKLGISRWLSDNHKIILDGNGRILKLVGNIRDITDFKLVEDALNRSRDRLYKAIEATNDGMWDWRPNVNKIYFDARFYTMLGYEPLEFPAAVQEWLNRIHPEDIDHVKELLAQQLEGKSDQWLIEYRFLAKNGQWIWILNRGKVFERDEHGTPLRVVGTHSDISLRKQAEEELQKRNNELQTIYDQLQISEEKFRQLAENTQDVFWLRDEEHIIYINPAFDTVWGRDRKEVMKNPALVKQWIHPDDFGACNDWVNINFFKGRESYLERYRIIKPDGEIRWLWSRLFPVYNEKKEIYRLAGIASDITDQKLIEEALIATKEKALESDQLKSAFLANISHEIRTPMNGIIGFAELLKDDMLSSESRVQYVNIITKSSEQLLHIIDDIIDISKIEANQIKINKTKVKVVSLINDLKLFYEKEKIQMGKNQIDILTEVSPDLQNTVISTDESRLRQILMNLISNALKFTENGYVKFGFATGTNEIIEFYVEDTGMGIPSDRQSQIFKRFRQLDDTLTRKFGGTGLGLAICEGLIKLLGGRIWLTSEVGKGAKFYFTIPAQENNVKSNHKIRKTAMTEGEYNWEGKTILVVEDDEINQEFLTAVLTPTRAEIFTTSTGEEAIRLCSSRSKVDLVLMDIRLPQMNGYDAFEKIREKQPLLPVIAQTAFAMTEDAAKCLELGFTGYISKPINRKNLLQMINKLFTKTHT